jgi:WD40 repeat protein
LRAWAGSVPCSCGTLALPSVKLPVSPRPSSPATSRYLSSSSPGGMRHRLLFHHATPAMFEYNTSSMALTCCCDGFVLCYCCCLKTAHSPLPHHHWRRGFHRLLVRGTSLQVSASHPHPLFATHPWPLAHLLPPPPRRFKKSLTDHSRFVTCTRFSPNGEKVATVGLDKKGIIWDGKTGYAFPAGPTPLVASSISAFPGGQPHLIYTYTHRWSLANAEISSWS